LQPTDPPEWIRDRLVGDEREILLTGHFPSLPRILHLLVTGDSDGSAEEFPLHGLVAMERQEAVWIVKWRLEGRA
jgi:phosphohistidine phosphatase SixA